MGNAVGEGRSALGRGTSYVGSEGSQGKEMGCVGSSLGSVSGLLLCAPHELLIYEMTLLVMYVGTADGRGMTGPIK